MIRSILAAALLASAGAVQAYSLPVWDLPQAFLDELASGTVDIEFGFSDDGPVVMSTADFGGFHAYEYTRDGESRWLLQYDVRSAGSSWNSVNFGTTVLDGDVFLEVPDSFDPGTDGHEVRIHLDALIPDVAHEIFFYANGAAQDIAIDGGALASGSAEYNWSGDPYYQGSGTMSSDYFPYYTDEICIECRFDILLDLVFVDFSGGSVAFDFADQRTNVFNIVGYGYDPETPYDILNIAVRPVPVPGALVLMISGLISLGTLAGKNARFFSLWGKQPDT